MIDTQQCGQNVGYAAIFIFFKDLIMDFLFQYLKENNLTLSSCEKLYRRTFCARILSPSGLIAIFQRWLCLLFK
jgi:hypothetical protein